MSEIITIKRGLDIKLYGEPSKTITDLQPTYVAVKPTDFAGFLPKLLVKEGDMVKAGSPVIFDKHRENIVVTSPVAGKVTEIRRGEKRLLEEILIEVASFDEQVELGTADPATADRRQITDLLIKSGLWATIRQRPYNVIADPEKPAKSVFISAFDTAPLAPDLDLLIEGRGSDFQKGIDALAKLTNGRVFLNIGANTQSPVFTGCKNAQVTRFKGPHPASNESVHISRLDPINKGETVWTVDVQDVAAIGHLLVHGKIDSTRIIALAGSEVNSPQLYKTKRGAIVSEIVADKLKDGGTPRIISGNVLSGTNVGVNGAVGFYDNMLTVIPEGNQHEFLGWALPGFGKMSTSRSYFSWLNPGKKYRLDTNTHGGVRAYVMTGLFERVFPFDIYPLELVKAVLANDIDKMENLGIYEVIPEDFALCEFVDTSKTEIQHIIATGLENLRREMN